MDKEGEAEAVKRHMLAFQTLSLIHHLNINRTRGNPLQCSCLENPRDQGAWWAAVYGVVQKRTRLKRLSSSRARRCGSYNWFNMAWFIFSIPFTSLSLLFP